MVILDCKYSTIYTIIDFKIGQVYVLSTNFKKTLDFSSIVGYYIYAK
jgi:hypothetical protein